MNQTVKSEDIKAFDKTEKLGLIATVDKSGDPHLSLITTLMAKDEKTMIAGQFAQGISKENMLARPKSGFAIVTLDKKFWTGFVKWTHMLTEGEEYIRYNNMPMWRFNTYFGIEKVFYGDLVGISDKAALNILGIAVNWLRLKLCQSSLKSKEQKEILRPFSVKIFGDVNNPKFASFINADGYPTVVPAVQAIAVGKDRIAFTAAPYKEGFQGLKAGARVAVFCCTMEMESVLVKGSFSGFKNGMGIIDIDRVYNSMPPVPRYIYPYEENSEVTEF